MKIALFDHPFPQQFAAFPTSCHVEAEIWGWGAGVRGGGGEERGFGSVKRGGGPARPPRKITWGVSGGVMEAGLPSVRRLLLLRIPSCCDLIRGRQQASVPGDSAPPRPQHPARCAAGQSATGLVLCSRGPASPGPPRTPQQPSSSRDTAPPAAPGSPGACAGGGRGT